MTRIEENRAKFITFVLLILTGVFTIIDISLDLHDGVPIGHLLYEIAVWLVSVLGAFFQFKIIKWQSSELFSFKQKIEELGLDNKNLIHEQGVFQQKILHLSNEFLSHIDEQFKNWNFSRAEKEIALLLIKGLSMKEIADIRGSSESTVRQQASQVYRKCSLGGRMELSAFFLDDLLAISKLPE
jgi:DNA-binding CsgD family transcriptional regulator